MWTAKAAAQLYTVDVALDLVPRPKLYHSEDSAHARTPYNSMEGPYALAMAGRC